MYKMNIMKDYSYHIFVLIFTVLYYFLLRRYTLSKNNKNTILYLSFCIPVILYSSYYFISLNNYEIKTSANHSVFSDLYENSVIM